MFFDESKEWLAASFASPINHMHEIPPCMQCDCRKTIYFIIFFSFLVVLCFFPFEMCLQLRDLCENGCFSEVVGRDKEFVNGEYSNFDLSTKFAAERG
ncbi:hypothetical protein CEXT_662261 [Caerostris extrusa]|uniref:Uncharacterized protein n=1 Tax=Caerostris extrusa TaxID=172846 RepID=A0AAV4XTA8_CAEEX|nr:hypothetical protein CEXT_662261 [Caerostris extrusa]